MSLVTHIPPAAAAEAEAHFAHLLAFETDCWDVHESLNESAQNESAQNQASPDFVLLDVRGKGGFDAGHIEGAIHWPHAELTEERLADYPRDTVFVVYCAGPHCNGADRAALRLARLGRPVKKMIGGIEGWIDEGFDLAVS